MLPPLIMSRAHRSFSDRFVEVSQNVESQVHWQSQKKPWSEEARNLGTPRTSAGNSKQLLSFSPDNKGKNEGVHLCEPQILSILLINILCAWACHLHSDDFQTCAGRVWLGFCRLLWFRLYLKRVRCTICSIWLPWDCILSYNYGIGGWPVLKGIWICVWAMICCPLLAPDILNDTRIGQSWCYKHFVCQT